MRATDVARFVEKMYAKNQTAAYTTCQYLPGAGGNQTKYSIKLNIAYIGYIGYI